MPCSYDPCKNESLVIALKVERDGVIENWLEMRKSTIKDGGFGVFPLHDFLPKEFVTASLGQKIDYTFMYKDIVSLPKNWKTNGFQEEYSLGHWINHGIGSRRNLEMKGKYDDMRHEKNQGQRRIILGLQP
jgi:hypothetical protein